MIAYNTFQSPVGVVLIAAGGGEIIALDIVGPGSDAKDIIADIAKKFKPNENLCHCSMVAANGRLVDNAITQLSEYFSGKRRVFDLPVNLQCGTAFQHSVWKALATVPFGETVSYKDIAIKIGRPRAVRAVGSAVGKNPIPIIIPCHRVLPASGQLGGFSLIGPDVKRALLDIENGIFS